MFQSRKQDYFNWKQEPPTAKKEQSRFSPASRIILIESHKQSRYERRGNQFQSRKQDYFNWKSMLGLSWVWTAGFQSRKQDYFNWKSRG